MWGYRETDYNRERMGDKKCVSAYWEMEKKWGRELYTSCCKLNDRNAIAWFKLWIWKLIGLGKGEERGRYPVCKWITHTSEMQIDKNMDRTIFTHKMASNKWRNSVLKIS